MITSMPRIAIAMSDYASAIETFRDRLGLPVLDFSERTVPSLGAHVGMCMPEGGSNIELMSPANPEMALSQSLQKFLDRRGEGFYAMMLEAPDPDAEAAVIAERGLSVLPLMEGAGGRDIHPRSTHGVLIRVYPNDSVGSHPPQDGSEPGLSGITKAILATSDAALAGDTYRRGFGLDVGPAEHDDERGVITVVCRPPKGGLIEFVSVVDSSRPFAQEIELFIKERNEGLYALVLKADDPASAASVLAGRGIGFGGSTQLETSLFGARILLEK